MRKSCLYIMILIAIPLFAQTGEVTEPPCGRPRTLSDAELAAKIGLNQQTGAVSNSFNKVSKLEIDTAGLYAFRTGSLKTGLSGNLWKSNDARWRLNLDIASELAGLSLNHTFGGPIARALRFSLGGGYGYSFGSDGRYLDSVNASRGVAYVRGSIRLW